MNVLRVPRCAFLLAWATACSASPSEVLDGPRSDGAGDASTGAARGLVDASRSPDAGRTAKPDMDRGCDPDSVGCAGSGAAPAADPDPGSGPLPLLGSTHGGHVWSRFCASRPDDAALPVDPRTRVQPGTNAGRAVHFNAPWIACREDAPRTCGEYRAGFERGKAMMEKGGMWFFGGNHTDAMLTISAFDYNAMWVEWGLLERPENYDALVAERRGTPLGEARNPYPLPGEDPTLTNGGSGQLPLALTQLRDAEGAYLGTISFNCHWCHSGRVGTPQDGEGLGTLVGSSNSLLDVSAGFGEFAGGATALLPGAANKVRGSGDILLYPRSRRSISIALSITTSR